MSRSDLGLYLGLTRSTTGQLVADLARRGLVREEMGAPSGAPGRPSSVVHPAAEGVAVLAMQIEVNSLAVALVGLGGRCLGNARVPHAADRLGPVETVADLAGLAEEVVASTPSGCRVVGLGVAFCGVIRRADGFVHLAPNLGWRDVELGKMVAPPVASHLPVVVLNDADASTLAEHRRGAGVGTQTMAYVGGEVGVGGGVIVGGRLLQGAATSATELGHWPLNPRGRRCRCGGVGCWETEVSQLSLLRRAHVDGKPPYQDTVADVLEAARRGEAVPKRAVRETVRWLSLGLAGVVNVFDPELIVVGDFFAELFDFAGDEIINSVRSRSLLPAARSVRIVPAKLGEDAALVGAAEAAFEPLVSQPWSLPPLAGAA